LLAALVITSLQIYSIQQREKFRERQLYLEETKVHNELFNNTQNIYAILDQYIVEYINEDRLFNGYSTNEYINEEEQNRIIKDVSTKILEEMSPIFYNQLSCYFDKDAIVNIVTRRVISIVIGIVVEANHGVKMKETRNDDYNRDLDRIIKENF
jgi:hypothetical protein